MTRILTIIALLFATPALAVLETTETCGGENITGDDKPCIGLVNTKQGQYFGHLFNSSPNGFGLIELANGKIIGIWNDGKLQGWSLLKRSGDQWLFQEDGSWKYRFSYVGGKIRFFVRQEDGDEKRLSQRKAKKLLEQTNFEIAAGEMKVKAEALQKISDRMASKAKIASYKSTCMEFGHQLKEDGSNTDSLKKCIQELYLKDKELANASSAIKGKQNKTTQSSQAEGATSQAILSELQKQNKRASNQQLINLGLQLMQGRPSGVAPLTGVNSLPSMSSGTFCFKKSEYVSGMNKNCIYDCLGSEAVQTIGATGLCPLNITR